MPFIRDIENENIYNRLFNIKANDENDDVEQIINNISKKLESFDFNKFKSEILSYTESLKLNDFEYTFSENVKTPTLYSSVYACMIKGLLGAINEREKKGWCEYFNSFQRNNGLFYDNSCYNERYDEGDNWGARHLQAHIIIAYARLGFTPDKIFTFLEPFKDSDYVIKWLERQNFSRIWGASNQIMNYGVLFQYARDYMKMPMEKTISTMQDWLLNNIREDCGMWFDGSLETNSACYEALRGAYHIYPIFQYDKIQIPYAEKAINIILKLQNKWGGFDNSILSSACADIDAIDPLIRLSIQTKSKALTQNAIRKALAWLMSNQNPDGGFVFEREKSFCYGTAPLLSSKPNTSNLFGTWFRLLSVLYMLDFLNIHKTDYIKIPGYESPLF